MNDVTLFMWYMYNVWDIEESISLFGKDLGEHIYEKMEECEGNYLKWYSLLDVDCRNKVVDRARSYYQK